MSEEMNTQWQFRTTKDWTGSRLIYVPVKMYLQNKLLSAVGLKTQRWLRIDLDRATVSFHHNLTDIDPKEEISFSMIKSVDADFSEGKSDVYYLNIHGIDGSEYKFRFQNLREFYEVVEAFKHTMRGDQTSLLSGEDLTLHINQNKEKLSKPIPTYGHISNIKFDDANEPNNYIDAAPLQKITTYAHTEGGYSAHSLKNREEQLHKKEQELKELETKIKLQESVLVERESALKTKQ